MADEWDIFVALAREIGPLLAADAFRQMGASMKQKEQSDG